MQESSITLALDPALSLSVSLGKQLEQIRQAQLNMVKQYNQIIEMALTSTLLQLTKSISASQEVLAKNLLRAINPLALVKYPEAEDVEAEIVEDNNLFKLSTSIEGRFYWENSLIETITTDSKHGKLLKMLFEADNNYVTDEEIANRLDVSKDRGVGYVRRDMKSALEESGLKADLYREKRTGYRLLGIKKLPN